MQTTTATPHAPSARRAEERRSPAFGRDRRARLFRHELAALARTAGPIVLSQLGLIGMSTIDTLMVGPLGAVPLAAVAFSTAIHSAVLVVCSGTLVGMSPLVSQAFGAGRPERCRAVLVQGLWLSLLLGVPLVASSLAGEWIARVLGQDPAVAALSGGYMRALAPGAPAALLFMAFRQYLEGMGVVRPPMAMTLLGLALNVVCNAVLIHGIDGWVPAMGAVGSGWATTLVRWGMVLALILYLVRHPRLSPIAGVRRRPDRALLRQITGIGLPIGAQNGLEVGLFSGAAVMMGWIGATELAAHQITINLAATTFMVGMGVSIAGSIRVGQHLGAGNPRAVRRAVGGTYLLALGFMGLCALVFVAAPEFLIGLYSRDPEVVRTGARLLLLAAAFQLFDGAQVAGISLLRGAADTRLPMAVAAFGYWIVGLPVAWALGFPAALGPVGIWIGLLLALVVVAVLLGSRVRRRLLRPQKPAGG